MIKEAILKLAKKEDLTYQEAEAVMNEIMSGGATPVQMASYLTALSLKGETIEVSDLAGVQQKGWVLVCVEGYALGFGKLSRGILKNKYYAGWRMT